MELWSPAQSRDETCLFGRQVQYYRRIRDKQCWIGETLAHPREVIRNCTCTPNDFECEFNHRRNSAGECQLIEGAAQRMGGEVEEQCVGLEPYWYERTAYRKIPYSSCVGDAESRLDLGKRHECPGLVGGGRATSFFFWFLMALIPVGVAATAGWCFLAGDRRPTG